MPRLTITLTDDLQEWLDNRSGDGAEFSSKSEAVRECIKAYDRKEDYIEELEDEIAELETTVTRLRNEKQQILEQRDEKRELAKYVEDERTYREQDILTRAKWWLTGKPADA